MSFFLLASHLVHRLLVGYGSLYLRSGASPWTFCYLVNQSKYLLLMSDLVCYSVTGAQLDSMCVANNILLVLDLDKLELDPMMLLTLVLGSPTIPSCC